MEQNHCSVARKMMGLWQRQQWGYWCLMCTWPSTMPAAVRSARMVLLASHTFWPAYLPDSSVR